MRAASPRRARSLLRDLGASAIAMIDARLRSVIGVDDLDQLLDYAECVMEATAATAVPRIIKGLQGFDGLAIGLSLAPGGLALQLDVHASDIESRAREPQPLPAPNKALAGVPFTPLCVTMSGRSRTDAASPMLDAWTQAVLAKLAAAGLKPGIIGALLGYLHDQQRVPTLADAAPWSLCAEGSVAAAVPAQRSLEDFIKAATRAMGADAPVTVLPLAGPEPLIAQLVAAAATANANTKGWNERMEPYLGESWVDAAERFHADAQPGKPLRLVSESAYTTRSGLFGCSQHELINRVIWECQGRNGMLVLQRTVGDKPTALAAAAAPGSVPAGLAELAKLIKPGCDQAMLTRLAPVLPALVDTVSAAEASLHNEIDDYLSQARALLASAHAGDNVAAAIAKLPMPVIVESLVMVRDAANPGGELECVLAGHLSYPRPLISAVIKDLLAEPLAHAGEVGGLCLCTRAQPGLYSVSAQVDLRACERLLHDGGNAIATRYLTKPNPAQAVAQAIGAPGDGMRHQGEVVVRNPMWSF